MALAQSMAAPVVPVFQPEGLTGFGAGSDNPEIATDFRPGRLVRARQVMAVTAHPHASDAAYQILAAGGTVVDAAVAAQMVLNVVEPQSSGIGGGGFLLLFDNSAGVVRAFDGRETAPAAAWEGYLQYLAPGSTQPVVPTARRSGRSVGVPGLVRMLEMAHRRHGSMPWSSLFTPAIRLALEGFAVSPRLSASIAGSAEMLQRDPAAAAYFFTPTGQPLPTGWRLYSPELAQTLARIAAQGSAGFYQGEVAQAIVNRVSRPPGGATPGWLSLTDLHRYTAVERRALCAPYRDWEVCGFPPPSSAGIAVAQMLGILQSVPLSTMPPRQTASGAIVPDPLAVHYLAEAGRLAFADRNHFVADTDFVPLPGGSPAALLDPDYLAQRAALLRPDRSLGVAEPGLRADRLAEDNLPGRDETTHISLVDMYGNALALTSSIEGAFGSYMMVKGFLLNNQLTDFSPSATDAEGRRVANRIEPGKRPRSSMAPTLVFERTPLGRRGRLVLVTGSPGGAAIIPYVANHLVALLDWGLNPAEAVTMPHFGAFNERQTVLEASYPFPTEGWPADLVSALRQAGHEVGYRPRPSGLATILLSPPELVRPLLAGADPRREGVALGD